MVVVLVFVADVVVRPHDHSRVSYTRPGSERHAPDYVLRPRQANWMPDQRYLPHMYERTSLERSDAATGLPRELKDK